MRAICALLAVTSCGIGSARAADFCAVLETPPSAETGVAHPITGDIAACRASRILSGGTQMHCAWVFPYRSTAAADAFDQLNETVAGCLGDRVSKTKDPAVNHPDFYDLQVFRIDGHEIGISLKDKASLSETYVFLRLTRPE